MVAEPAAAWTHCVYSQDVKRTQEMRTGSKTSELVQCDLFPPAWRHFLMVPQLY